MSEGCEQITVSAEIALSFRGCKEHGDFDLVSGMLSTGGMDRFSVIDGALSVIQETITHMISHHPSTQSALNFEHEWIWSNTPEQLPDRAKQRVIRLMAHSLLVRRVAGQGYMKDMQSAALEVPMSD